MTGRHAKPSERRAAVATASLVAAGSAVGLLVPQAAEAASAVPPVPVQDSHTATTPSLTVRNFLPRALSSAHVPEQYTVRSGDSLSSIATKVCDRAADWPALWQANHIKDPNLIYPGDALTVACHVLPGAAVAAAHWESPPPVADPPARPAVRLAARSQPAATFAPDSASWQQIVVDILGNGPEAACADGVIDIESGGNVYATNPQSGAYGIPQSLPGDKMAAAGPDWQTSAWTQLTWMLKMYIPETYGTACNALAHEHEDGWY